MSIIDNYSSNEIHNDESFPYPQLKSYITFLLNNNFQELLVDDIIARTQKTQTSYFIKYLSELSHVELYQWWYKSFIENFLQPIISSVPLNVSENDHDWILQDILTGFSIEEISIDDIIYTFTLRKQTLIHFLSYYSLNHAEWVVIFEELNTWTDNYVKKSLQKHNSIQQEMLDRNNRILKAINANLPSNSIPALIAYIDKDEKFRFVNSFYYNWFERTPGAFIGKTLEDVMPAYLYERIKPNVEKALSGEQVKFELAMECPKGQRTIEGKYVPDIAPDGGIKGYIAMLVDITDSIFNKEELQLANEELKSKNELLVKINNDLDNFIYAASHDLKAPISNLEGLILELRQLDPHTEEYEMIFQFIEQSIFRFKNTITDLTEIAKIQRNIEEGTSEINDLAALISEVENDLEGMIKEGKPTIVRELQAVTIAFPKKDLRSILLNLISNGIKYRDAERPCEIVIRSYWRESEIVLSIKDNGLGIPKEKHAQVFKMFKRIHDHVEGTGLGLYIIKRIMENHKGRIELKSELGEGSEFILYFPASTLTKGQ